MTFDFGGFATKFDIKCSDGRTIKPSAFDAMDGKTVPLVWQHDSDSPENILGHALLEKKPGVGMYAYATFNETPRGEHAKKMVVHKDVTALSIKANRLVQQGPDVLDGNIVELSLVVAGANPGALIDNIVIAHGDDYDVLEDEAIIYSGDEIDNIDETTVSHSEGSAKMATGNTETKTKTVGDIYDAMTEEQQNVVQYLVEQALNTKDEAPANSDTVAQSDEDGENPVQHSDQEGNTNMTRNVFEGDATKDAGPTLTHAQVKSIFEQADKLGSLKEAVLAHAATYGIQDIELLFPDAKNLTATPDWIKRRTEWVNEILSNTNHTPFSRIRSVQADITADEARAKGYIKGNLKKDEVFKLLKRVTGPTTIYKKQKLDRDDILDITDFDVVAWIRGEMRLMLEEEIARAVMIGDGRAADDPDKINEDNIRPIWKEDPLYAIRVDVTTPADSTELDAFIEAVALARVDYEGSGTPKLYVAPGVLTRMLLMKDTTGRRLYETEASLAAAMRVSGFVEIPQFEGQVVNGKRLLGIMVNLNDYTIGADRGGQTTMFDDFDIDFNQYKYLLETRMSGALRRVKSAVILETSAAQG